MRLVTVSPSSCEVILMGGGVVSAWLDVVVVESCVSSTTAVGSSAVTSGSSDTMRGSVVVVGDPGAAVWGSVVAIRVSASENRSASTAEATRAEAARSFSVTVDVTGSWVDENDDGENAANPITAMNAVTRSPAYASGIRGLTKLREGCG